MLLEKGEHVKINEVLNRIDQFLTEKLNHGAMEFIYDGVKAYIEKPGMTDKQRSALHVWCKLVAEALNDAGLYYRYINPFTGEEMQLDWTKERVKEFIYKPVLEAKHLKTSTEDQDTVEPSSVALEIHRHFANHGAVLPSWPSNRYR